MEADGNGGASSGALTRRGMLRGATMLTLGAGIGAAGFAALVGDGSSAGGAAAAATVRGVTGRGQLTVTWEVQTQRQRVALTFDDGPRPNWTTRVLDTLDEYGVPATFFMVGERVRQHAGIIRDRMARHEVGNHTWAHRDVVDLDEGRVRKDLARAHEAITEAVGRAPALFRPPHGRLGGAALAAAADMDYQVVLWSRKMREAHYTTEQQVAAVLRETTPGTIMLAHDVGNRDRLVSIRGLPAMIVGLRERGFEFVTVSQLLEDGPGRHVV